MKKVAPFFTAKGLEFRVEYINSVRNWSGTLPKVTSLYGAYRRRTIRDTEVIPHSFTFVRRDRMPRNLLDQAEERLPSWHRPTDADVFCLVKEERAEELTDLAKHLSDFYPQYGKAMLAFLAQPQVAAELPAPPGPVLTMVPTTTRKNVYIHPWHLDMSDAAKYGLNGKWPSNVAIRTHLPSVIQAGYQSEKESLEIKFPAVRMKRLGNKSASLRDILFTSIAEYNRGVAQKAFKVKDDLKRLIYGLLRCPPELLTLLRELSDNYKWTESALTLDNMGEFFVPGSLLCSAQVTDPFWREAKARL
ncbi:unnamed protein product [Effrenium voratum]|uniref:Uncharacterized protein n=1 Tax=Effrenium voratum TaxID=2562239 RepID=A0AA36MQU0_9DINO|nr:unnamed protein product [Effrenium voratum]